MKFLKKQMLIWVFLLWLVTICFFMILAETINLWVFYELLLIGLMGVVLLFEPSFTEPRYIHNIKYVLVAGVVVFGMIFVINIVKVVSV